MLLEGTPKVHLVPNSDRWYVWLSIPLTMMSRRTHGLEATPLSTAVRDGDRMAQQEVRILAESSLVIFQDSDAAELFAGSLAAALEADIDRSPSAIPPEHDIIEP